MKKHFATVQEKANYYTNLAADFVRSSSKDKYYIASYDESDGGLENVEFYAKLTDAQLSEIKAAMAEAANEEISFKEYWLDKDLPEYLDRGANQWGDWYNLNSVNIEDVYYSVESKIAIFESGVDSAHEVHTARFYLPQDEYIELLAWQLQNRYSNFNDLFESNPELFTVVNSNLRALFVDCQGVAMLHTPIYAVELTEMLANANEILGDKPISCTVWQSYESNNFEHCVLTIDERVLEFFYEQSKNGNIHMDELSNVDAQAVAQALGVEGNVGIANWANEHCTGADGVETFCKLLDEHNIKYDRAVK